MKNFRRMVLVASVAALAGYTAYSSQKSTVFKLGETNVEALASDESWWNRKDYNCVSVTCNCIFYTYNSEVAEYAGDGKGSVAHTWNCAGCGNCGW